jgi:hypothetical protein
MVILTALALCGRAVMVSRETHARRQYLASVFGVMTAEVVPYLWTVSPPPHGPTLRVPEAYVVKSPSGVIAWVRVTGGPTIRRASLRTGYRTVAEPRSASDTEAIRTFGRLVEQFWGVEVPRLLLSSKKALSPDTYHVTFTAPGMDTDWDFGVYRGYVVRATLTDETGKER